MSPKENLEVVPTPSNEVRKDDFCDPEDLKKAEEAAKKNGDHQKAMDIRQQREL